LATTNERNQIAQRGRNKAKRHDLRQVGLALLVTRDHQVPLFHKVYQGNIPDVSLFPQLARSIIRRCNRTLSPRGEATLVFDKGNVSDDGMEQLVVSTQHFVAALPSNRLPDLVGRSLEQFHGVDGVPGTKAFSEDLIWWGKSCKAVVAYTESFFTQQLCGVTRNLARCQKKLLDLDKNLAKWRKGNGRGKRPTIKQVERSVASILSPQFMKDVFRVRVEVDASLPRLSYELDHTSFDKLTHQRLGRTLLITDQIEWSNKEVIEAYRSLTNVEEAFRNMKNVDFLRWQPAHHWTDQKTMVHGFYCVLALLLTTLARKLVLQAGIDLSLPALLKDLTSIREVAVIYPSGTLAHRKDHVTLSRMSPRQRKLADILKIGKVMRG
jgi:transposase